MSSLIEAGHMTGRLTTRRAQPRRCRKCGRGVLAGLDGDVLAFDVDADPVALTVAGEAAARLEGRRTFTLRTAGRPELDRRDHSWRAPGALVVAEHRCGRRVPDAWREPPRPSTSTVDEAEIPF